MHTGRRPQRSSPINGGNDHVVTDIQDALYRGKGDRYLNQRQLPPQQHQQQLPPQQKQHFDAYGNMNHHDSYENGNGVGNGDDHGIGWSDAHFPKYSAQKPQPPQLSHRSQQNEHQHKGYNGNGSYCPIPRPHQEQQYASNHGKVGHHLNQQLPPQQKQHFDAYGNMNHHDSYENGNGVGNGDDHGIGWSDAHFPKYSAQKPQPPQLSHRSQQNEHQHKGYNGNGSYCPFPRSHQAQQYASNRGKGGNINGNEGGNRIYSQQQQYADHGPYDIGDGNHQYTGYRGVRPYTVYHDEKQPRSSYHGCAVSKLNLRHQKIQFGEYVSPKCMRPPNSIEFFKVKQIWGETEWYKRMSWKAKTVLVGHQRNGGFWLHQLDKNNDPAYFVDQWGRKLAIVLYSRANWIRLNMKGLRFLGTLGKIRSLGRDDVYDKCCDQGEFFTEIPLGSTVYYEERTKFTGSPNNWASVGIVEVLDLKSLGKWTKRLECPNCTQQQQWANYQQYGHVAGRFWQ